MKIKIGNNTLPSLMLRIGLASVLLYAAISSFITPSDWLGYLPHILTTHASGAVLLHFFSVYEITLAIWLLSGVYLKVAATVSALTFSGIILTNLGVIAITFRDINMVFASLAILFIES